MRMPHGIYVLTTAAGEERNGMIASWVSQVSYDPPLIMVALHPDRYSHALIEQSHVFALHLLGGDRKDFLQRFKGEDVAGKFLSVKWFQGRTGCPVLEDCLGYVECEVKEKYEPGNHTLYIGRVLEGRVLKEGEPLTTLAYEGVYLGNA